MSFGSRSRFFRSRIGRITLLAILTVTAGLYLAFQLAGEWLEGEKRAAVLFLLALIPFYNFLGLKFDQNSALIPLWALAIWSLVRSLETRAIGWSVLCGVTAAAAMLTKYWSMFLLLALALAVLFDRRRNAYLLSPAPWVTALVCGALVAPHAVWLVQNDFPPLDWVSTRRLGDRHPRLAAGSVGFRVRQCRLCVVALILWALAVRPSRDILRDSCIAVRADAASSRDPVLDAVAGADRCLRAPAAPACCRSGMRRRSICCR